MMTDTVRERATEMTAPRASHFFRQLLLSQAAGGADSPDMFSDACHFLLLLNLDKIRWAEC